MIASCGRRTLRNGAYQYERGRVVVQLIADSGFELYDLVEAGSEKCAIDSEGRGQLYHRVESHETRVAPDHLHVLKDFTELNTSDGHMRLEQTN